MTKLNALLEDTPINELLSFIERKVKEILVDEYHIDKKDIKSIYNESTLKKLMKETPNLVLHHSPEYWAEYVYEEYQEGSQ